MLREDAGLARRRVPPRAATAPAALDACGGRPPRGTWSLPARPHQEERPAL